MLFRSELLDAHSNLVTTNNTGTVSLTLIDATSGLKIGSVPSVTIAGGTFDDVGASATLYYVPGTGTSRSAKLRASLFGTQLSVTSDAFDINGPV